MERVYVMSYAAFLITPSKQNTDGASGSQDPKCKIVFEGCVLVAVAQYYFAGALYLIAHAQYSFAGTQN